MTVTLNTQEFKKWILVLLLALSTIAVYDCDNNDYVDHANVADNAEQLLKQELMYYRFKFSNQLSKKYSSFIDALLDAIEFEVFELFEILKDKPAKLMAKKGIEY